MFNSLKIALFLGIKSLIRGNKAVSALMILILSLAFINLIFISSILDGILNAINKQIITNVVSNVVIDPQEQPVRKNYIEHTKELKQQISSLPGVAGVASHYKFVATAAFDKEKNGKFKYNSTQITSIDPEEEKKISSIADNMVAGQYLEGLGNDEIIIGGAIAGGFPGVNEFTSLEGVKVGNKIKISYRNGVTKDYTVKGIFITKFEEVDRMAFITNKEAESILSVYNNASQILVKIDKTGNEDYYIEKIQAMARNLKVRKWTDYMGPMAGISESFGIINLIITFIGLIVAAITIFILIYVNVVNKRRQIGILKAIGIKKNIIIYSYIFQALFYAIFGTILGLIILFYLINPYFVAHPLDMPIGDVGLLISQTNIFYSTLSLLAAALIAALLPSWRAASENILKAIWGN